MQFKGKYAFLSLHYGSGTPDGTIVLSQEEITAICDPIIKPIFLEDIYKNGVVFPTLLHGFLCLRTNNMQDFMRIYNEKNPFDAQAVSKTCNPRKNWSYYREKVLYVLVAEKFHQHPNQLEKLLAIQEPIHNDITYNDYFMGRNIYTNTGSDKLGQIIRQVRNKYLSIQKETFIPQSKYTLYVQRFLNQIKNKEFYILDTETTGFGIDKSDAIEVSMLRVDGNTFDILDEYDSFINPGYKLPARIAAFNADNQTGITDAILQRAPKADVIAKELYNFMGNAPIIMGHNINYDIPYINKIYLQNLGIPFTPPVVIDTLKMAKEKVDGPCKLGILYSKIPNAPDISFHRSIDDIKATLEVFKWLVPKYEQAELEVEDIAK